MHDAQAAWTEDASRARDGISGLPVVRPSGPPDAYVALLVDYPILLRAVRATDAEAVPDLARLVARASRWGSLLAARAYGAWYDVDEAAAAFAAGVDPTFVPPTGPGVAPTTTALVADGVLLVLERPISHLVVAGDDRLLPLLAFARAHGVEVSLCGFSGRASGPCTRLATTVEPAAAFARGLSRGERYRRPVVPLARGA